MANIFGKAFSAVLGALAPGTSHDAGLRRFRNSTSLVSEGGGTVNTLIIGRIREGCAIDHFKVASDVNLSAINFTIGTAAAPAKYCAAFAGPAAGATVIPPVLPAMQAADALTVPEEIILAPSAALPAAGLIVASGYASKR